VAVFGTVGFFVGRYYFENPETLESFDRMRKILENEKCALEHKEKKYKDIDAEDEKKVMGKFDTLMGRNSENILKTFVTKSKDKVLEATKYVRDNSPDPFSGKELSYENDTINDKSKN